MISPRRLTESELHAFVDGELTGEERADAETALSAFPADLEAVRVLRDLNEALKQRYAARLDEPLPPALRRPLARFAGAGASIVRPLERWAAAAAIVIAAAAAGYLSRGLLEPPRGAEAQFVTTALGAHAIFVPEVRHPVEVKADEAHLVRWLAKRLGADVRAPALAGLGWRLMGGRLLPDQGLPAAQFMYEDADGRRLTLYLRKEPGLNNTSFRFHDKDGVGTFYWIDQPLAYALTGRLSREELMSLANAVYAQLDVQDPAKAQARPSQSQPQ